MGKAFGMWPGDVMRAPGSVRWAARFTAYEKAHREADAYLAKKSKPKDT